jgi:type II secretory pathway component PulF
MSTFAYRAKDEQGLVKTGIVEAVSSLAASEVLHGHGLTVVTLEPQLQRKHAISKYIPFVNKVSRKDIVVFSRQLSTLINAKVPIVQALDILSEQISNKILHQAILDLIEDVTGGKSLSEAMTRFPEVFSDLYVHLVKSGELSGTLDRSLLYIADQQEKDYDLVSKVRGALTYPIFIVTAIFVVGALMFVFVLPQLISVLNEAGAALPLTTLILIFVTQFVQHFWALILLIVIGGIFAFEFYIHSRSGRLVWDNVKMKFPVFGKLLKNIYMDRFALNLSSLVAGGIPIVHALQTVAAVIGNKVYQEIILEAASEVETGKSIGASFAEHHEIPKLVTQMIKIGEQTGTLDDILGKLANFYDKEVATTLNTLTTLMEPIIMILLGVAVAVMVAGILLPIYNLASAQ